jgi:hypothetical protein
MVPETLHDLIVGFLNSGSSKKQFAWCRCGAAIEHRKTTLFYDGRRWDIVLQVCLKCHPAASFPISHDA